MTRRFCRSLTRATLPATARRAALPALLALAAPAAAHAQFGGILKKAVGDKAAEQLLGRQEGVTPRTGDVEFTDRVIEITSARLDQLLRALAAEEAAPRRYAEAQAAEERRIAAARKVYEAKKPEHDRLAKAYDLKDEEYRRCADRAMGEGLRQGAATVTGDPAMRRAHQRIAAMTPAERASYERRQEEFGERYNAAKERGDQAAMKAIRDSTDAFLRSTIGVTLAQAERSENEGESAEAATRKRETAKCGPEPTPPPALEEPTNSLPSEEDFARDASRRASGLPAKQFEVLRERVAGYMALKHGRGTPTGYVFTRAEHAALAAREKQLEPYLDALTGGGATTWSF